VLTVVDRAGRRRADVLADRRAESLVARLEARLEAHVGKDAVLCSDGDGAYGLFARARAMPHYRLPKDGRRVIDTAFHIQTVNNLHSRFESFMKPFCKPFCGPATKHLPRYAACGSSPARSPATRPRPTKPGTTSSLHDQHTSQTPPSILHQTLSGAARPSADRAAPRACGRPR